MGEWPISPLRDLVDANRSICYGIVQPGAPVIDGVPIVRVNNIKDGVIKTDDVLRVDPLIEEKYKRSRLHGGEILVTLVGTIGLSAIAPAELRGWNVARAVGVVPIKHGVDTRWVKFVLQSRAAQDYIEILANTTVQSTFNLKDLATLPIPLPPDEIRVPASELLCALDDKIELNRRMNETLEATARAIFRDWFVDFGPTRAKQDGRPAYLAPDLWSLFPDRLDDEGKPERWAGGKVADLLELAYGKSLPANARKPGPVPVYGSGGIAGFHDGALIDGPAIIVGRKGTVGSLYWEDRPSYPIDTVFYVLPNAPLTYCYYLLEALPLRDMNTDAAVPGLNRSNVHRLEVPRPPCEMLNAYDGVARDLRRRVAFNLREMNALAETRDLLLPKLMSGEIRIKDAENVVGEVI